MSVSALIWAWSGLCLIMVWSLNWWKEKPSGSIACTRKQQPRFYRSCSSVVMAWSDLCQIRSESDLRLVWVLASSDLRLVRSGFDHVGVWSGSGVSIWYGSWSGHARSGRVRSGRILSCSGQVWWRSVLVGGCSGSGLVFPFISFV